MTAPTLMPEAELNLLLEQTDDGTGSAVFDSAARNYRYLLTRIWDPSLPLAVWIMCNPSTAGAHQDDATIRRCTTFAKDEWGRGGIAVVNLFAVCSTDPALLRAHPNPVGPHNAAFVRQAVRESDLVVCAWGGPGVLADRGLEMARALTRAGVTLRAFGVTSTGQPKHPLYLAKGTPLVDYVPEES